MSDINEFLRGCNRWMGEHGSLGVADQSRLYRECVRLAAEVERLRGERDAANEQADIATEMLEAIAAAKEDG